MSLRWHTPVGLALLLLPVWETSATAAEPATLAYLSQLAHEQLEAGHEAQAIHTYQKMLLADPGNQDAKTSLTRLQAKRLTREMMMEDALNRLSHRPPAYTEPASQEPGSWARDGRRTPETPEHPLSLTSVNLSGGYRTDDFDWNIAGDMNGQNPNVLSELTWRNLEMYQLSGEATWDLPHAYLRANAAKAWIVDGENQDSDYLGDDRTLEFSRSSASTGDRSAMDLSLGAGLPLRVGDRLAIIPLGGVSYHELKLNDTEGVQTIPDTGSFGGLNSTYESFWLGPWAGVDIVYATARWKVLTSAEAHWADYSARADWNLRTDFQHPKSFTQEAEATGLVTSCRLEYALSRTWAVRAAAGYAVWSTHPGHDVTYGSDGTNTETRLNEVNWESLSLSLGVTATF